MIVFIKDRKTFATKVMVTAADYEIHESIYNAVSNITIPTPKELPSDGDFIMFDGMDYVGIITEVDVDGGETNISAVQSVNLFNREMFYSGTTYTYLEDHLKDLIDTNYTNCTDLMYKTPYLSVTAGSHTSGNILPDFTETAQSDDTPASVTGTTLTLDSLGSSVMGSVYSIDSYISKLRRVKDIVLSWGFTRTALTINIYKKSFSTYNIDLSNPRYKITEETFSNLTVGKLSVFCESNGVYYTRYLKTDGTIVSTDPVSDRVDGEWQTLIVRDYSDLTNYVADAFAQNYYSHKISFITDREFELYDRLSLRVDGKIFNSYVSGIVRTKGSDLITVECGELQTQYPFLERL